MTAGWLLERLTLNPLAGAGDASASVQGFVPADVTALTSFSCANASMTSAGTNPCMLALASPAPASGFSISLSSSHPAVSVPAAVVVQPNATQASFNATVSSFSTTQTATLTAATLNASQTFTIQLSVSSASSIFVDAAKGSDSATGTQASPLKTIQAAVFKANARNTKGLASSIIVNPGVYREKVSISAISG